jgi:hypothetical protein
MRRIDCSAASKAAEPASSWSLLSMASARKAIDLRAVAAARTGLCLRTMSTHLNFVDRGARLSCAGRPPASSSSRPTSDEVLLPSHGLSSWSQSSPLSARRRRVALCPRAKRVVQSVMDPLWWPWIHFRNTRPILLYYVLWVDLFSFILRMRRLASRLACADLYDTDLFCFRKCVCDLLDTRMFQTMLGTR